MYHEASHVRFGQRFHTLAQDNFDVSLRAGYPLLYVLNEGAATWTQYELGEMQEPATDRKLYGFNLKERVINGNADVSAADTTSSNPSSTASATTKASPG